MFLVACGIPPKKCKDRVLDAVLVCFSCLLLFYFAINLHFAEFCLFPIQARRLHTRPQDCAMPAFLQRNLGQELASSLCHGTQIYWNHLLLAFYQDHHSFCEALLSISSCWSFALSWVVAQPALGLQSGASTPWCIRVEQVLQMGRADCGWSIYSLSRESLVQTIPGLLHDHLELFGQIVADVCWLNPVHLTDTKGTKYTTVQLQLVGSKLTWRFCTFEDSRTSKLSFNIGMINIGCWVLSNMTTFSDLSKYYRRLLPHSRSVATQNMVFDALIFVNICDILSLVT